MSRSFGIDIGTTFITVFDTKNDSVSLRIRHEGRILETLRSELFNAVGDTDSNCVFTGKAGKEIAESLKGVFMEEAVAVSHLLASLNGDFFGKDNGQLIDIGASSLTLYSVKENRVVDIAQNTLCAAGTGLFLEEQAQRLDIRLEELGELDIHDPPLIASRCTVFAKSDLIHHQQEGRSKNEMWSGLCRSLVVSAVNTLFRGEEPKGKIMICGGVSLNPEVLRWFRRLYPDTQWLTPPHSEALIARGASLIPGNPIGQLIISTALPRKKFKRMPPLSLHKSNYPAMPEATVDRFGNERRLHGNTGITKTVILGMDIGSTSTKLAVLDGQSHEPLADIYGRTSGDPVGAAKKIFASFYSIFNDNIHVKAFGTTGSGRKLVGNIFGADHIVNEISAHARGTVQFFPDVETIFEIGGQDAKFIRLENGFARDVNMNYVCAAGTGSFVEEQARKLGFLVQDIGDITENIAPPLTSDRCTVFMEQDLNTLLKAGFTKEEALASVLYSVIQNYLNRVVGNRPISSKKIFFQGATARNKGLVAALENLLEVEVAVSPFCHLMGAIGAALMADEFCLRRLSEGQGAAPLGTPITLREMDDAVSTFVGPEAIGMTITSRTETCQLCPNFCRINHISRSNDAGNGSHSSFSWGHQCGRDPEEPGRREVPEYSLFKQRQNALFSKELLFDNSVLEPKGEIILVNALTNHTYYRLWADFFNRLGYNVTLSGTTNSSVKKSSAKITSADFCFPVKVALGHVIEVLRKRNRQARIFFPYMIAEKTELKTAQSFFCPYVQSSASTIKSTLVRNSIPAHRLISPVIDFRQSERDIADALFSTLKIHLDVKKKDVLNAYKLALKSWRSFTSNLELKGGEAFFKLVRTGKPVFILLGRPYNLHDRGLNLGIPEKIASLGYPVIPLDMLPLDTASLSNSNYHNIFWKYGQRILAAARLASQYNNVFPIYFSNFNCGPDSFLLSFVEEELKSKPLLILELDEHDSDGGYLTRIEAFIDVMVAYMKSDPAPPKNKMPHIFTPHRTPNLNGTIWMPALHPSGYRLFASSFRAFGYDCRAVDPEDQEALVLGKKYLRGGECLPMALTLGNFFKHIRHSNPDGHHIIFMPTTEGPCRFGQYNLMERIIFHNLGMKNIDILSPSSINTYQGLPEPLRRQLMHAATASDVLFKMLTKIRPYERTKGDADTLFESGLQQISDALERKERPLKLIKKFASKFAAIPTYNERKPLVGIVGEIYVRTNSFANGNLIEAIESNGGEAWLAPAHEWFLYIAYMASFAAKKRNGNLLKRGESKVNNFYLFLVERNYYQAASAILHDRHEPHIKDIVQAGAQFLPEEFEGEAILTIGRSTLFAQQGADMVINVAPFGCMPGTLSSALLLEIKEKANIPFLSLFYDGDLNVNHKVAALLKTITLEKQKQFKSA